MPRATVRSEVSIERAACAWALKHLGIPSIKLNGIGQRGNPDRLFLLGCGKVLFVEFKRPGGKLTELQAHIHHTLRDRAYEVVTCYSLEEAKHCLEDAAHRAVSYT